MSNITPWDMLQEADSLLLHYLSKTGSLDEGLIKALVLLREIAKDFEVELAKIEIQEYCPNIH